MSQELSNPKALSIDKLGDFQLTQPPPGFVDDPYPWYALLRRHDPVHRLTANSFFLSSYDDVVAALIERVSEINREDGRWQHFRAGDVVRVRRC